MGKAIVREELERREHETLSPYACFSDRSLGRRVPEEPDALRGCFQCDRDRVLHSKSFRRLANKTQVFLVPEGDHYRTRLTHTLEVAQIARDIARPLGLNEDLTEAIALGHDLGHTPFGHVGERALSRAISRYRKVDPASEEGLRLFSHNEQSVRILEVLERQGRGLNLCHEVLDGIRCHRGSLRAMTLEGRVVAKADRIAYVCHDIDDAERAGLLSEEDLPSGPCSVLGRSSSDRISTMVQDLVFASSGRDDILMSEGVWRALSELRSFLFDHLYTKGDAKYEEPKADRMIEELFDYFVSHIDEIPDEYRRSSEDRPDVQVADYVAGMTDRYALRVFEELKVPRAWRVPKLRRYNEAF